MPAPPHPVLSLQNFNMAKKPSEPEVVEKKIEPLTQEFTSISEMNILRDKLNEIIKAL